MATLKQEILFFNDAVGRTLPGAKIYTYESGTSTYKDTFTDSSLVNLNTNPVIADDGGVFPPIFLESGAYRIVVTDENDVQLFDRDGINAAEGTVLTTSALYFDDLVDAKQGITITGETVDLQIGQTIVTLGTANETDDEGAQWLVVAGGTGTADDDAFADLDNGNQIQRLYNYLYTKNNLSEIAAAGGAAQSAARTNLNIAGQFLQIANNLSDVSNAATARTNLSIASEFLSRANNLSDVNSASTARTNLGIASEFLSIANNLSDVANAATARTNLGLDAPTVSGFTADIFYYSAEDYPSGVGSIDLIGSINDTTDSNVTVGPTGSGATIIDADLDILPSDTVYIDVIWQATASVSPADDSFIVYAGKSSGFTKDLRRAQCSTIVTTAAGTDNVMYEMSRIYLESNNSFTVGVGTNDVANTVVLGVFKFKIKGFGTV